MQRINSDEKDKTILFELTTTFNNKMGLRDDLTYSDIDDEDFQDSKLKSKHN